MPTEILIKSGTPKVWKASGGDGTLTLAALAASTGIRQGGKVDMGATRGAQWRVRVTLTFASTTTAGNAVNIYWGGSPVSTNLTGENPGGLTGADGPVTSANALKQLQFIGSFITDAVGTVTITQDVGVFTPMHQWGMFVVENKSTQNLADPGGATASSVAAYPVIDEAQ